MLFVVFAAGFRFRRGVELREIFRGIVHETLVAALAAKMSSRSGWPCTR
jgi:hypothetical protein